MKIEKGDFVCMHKRGSGQGWWVEVMCELKGRQEYQARYWSEAKNNWGHFNLAPQSHHMHMIKEVRKIPPEIAPMFRDLFIKGVVYD